MTRRMPLSAMRWSFGARRHGSDRGRRGCARKARRRRPWARIRRRWRRCVRRGRCRSGRLARRPFPSRVCGPAAKPSRASHRPARLMFLLALGPPIWLAAALAVGHRQAAAPSRTSRPRRARALRRHRREALRPSPSSKAILRAARDLLALLHEELVQDAVVEGLHLHGGLVRLDVREDVAALDFVAFLLAPLEERFPPSWCRELGHFDVSGHERENTVAEGRCVNGFLGGVGLCFVVVVVIVVLVLGATRGDYDYDYDYDYEPARRPPTSSARAPSSPHPQAAATAASPALGCRSRGRRAS